VTKLKWLGWICILILLITGVLTYLHDRELWDKVGYELSMCVPDEEQIQEWKGEMWAHNPIFVGVMISSLFLSGMFFRLDDRKNIAVTEIPGFLLIISALFLLWYLVWVFT